MRIRPATTVSFALIAALIFVFVCLKVTVAHHLSWWLIFAPLLIPSAIAFLFLVVNGFAMLITDVIEWLWEKE